ncbi:putative nucleotidyltransferase, ribonuclease H [Tanacetum coccineum]
MTPTKGMEVIKELSVHSISWYEEGNVKTEDKAFQVVLNQINKFENNINNITKEVRMARHKYETPMEDSETGCLPSSSESNPRGLAHAITTRSGLNYKPPKNLVESSQNKTTTEKITNVEEVSDNHMNLVENHNHYIPFPGRLKKEKEKEQFKKKGNTEENSKITLNERCSAVLLNKIPIKEKDPGSFTIPCIIGKMSIDKALADFGANISLMPYSMYERLDLGELKTTRMCIELEDKSTQYPRGIAENVIIKINKFIFPVAFVVLDMKEDHKIPIIFGRPFLSTTHAMIDVFNKKISFEVGSETITFDIEKSMKYSTHEDDNLLSEDIIDKAVIDLENNEDETKDLCKSGPFSDHDNLDSNEIIIPTLFTTNTRDAEKQPPKLKELPSHLEYAFLSNDQEFWIIISSLLNPQEKESLLKVLTKHKAALA